MSELSLTLPGYLSRPFFDLGPVCDDAPAYNAPLDMDRKNISESDDLPMLWQTMNASFREELVHASGCQQYALTDPRQLDVALRTPDWRALVEYVEEFPGLDARMKVKVLRVLNRLGLFACTIDLTSEGRPLEITDEASAGVSWLRAYARYRLHNERGKVDYSVDEFEHIATVAPSGLWKLAAIYQKVVQSVKREGNVHIAEAWQKVHSEEIVRVSPDISRHDLLMAKSRFHRVHAFVPQMKGDRIGTRREMELAERYAEEALHGDVVQLIYAKEIAWPVRESSIKEALWIEDLELALERALNHRDHDPFDARVWVNCGEVYLEMGKPENALEAYLEAARLAPPGGALINFMVGHCHEVLGDPDLALDRYLASLRIDPLAISSARGAMRVSEKLGSRILRWTQMQVESLETVGSASPPEVSAPHRQLPPPVDEALTGPR
ncbi:tetratricopeptide repeat protein [Streptomyces mirabilis]|uniref:tetratricopeptide repeat protein n=1 Tax=Streptomyces mirabilis TaxID=68239 RepID=UPI003697A4A9